VTSSGRAIARAGLIVTGAYLASRILGYVRTAVISTQFGASPQLDTYFAAFRIPDAIFQLVAAGAVASALIPIVSELLVNGEESRAWRVVSTITNLMLVALLVLAGAFALLAPLLMPWITPGFDAAQLDDTVRLTRIMLLSPILLALGAVATSVLNSLGRFAVSAAAPLLYNLGIIGGAIFLAPRMGVDGLAIGVVIGSAANLGIQAFSLLRGRFTYHPRLGLADPAARMALLLMAPRALGLAATQITFLVNNGFASGLGEGAITVYNVAFTLLQIPVGVVGVPLSIVLLPAMSRAFAAGETTRFADLTVRSLRLLAFLMLPATGLLIVASTQSVALLFLQGRFDAAATLATSEVLVVFALGLAAHAMVAILAPAFYAGKDTRTPVLAAVLAVAVNVAVAVVAVGPLGLRGLALAITLGAWVELAILLVLLERRVPAVDLGALGRGIAAILPGAVVGSLAAYLALRIIDGHAAVDASKVELAVQLAVAGGAAALVFWAYAAILRLEELRTLRLIVGELFVRPSRSVDGAP
jgi:putative peptidoglycan lipid II flippase